MSGDDRWSDPNRRPHRRRPRPQPPPIDPEILAAQEAAARAEQEAVQAQLAADVVADGLVVVGLVRRARRIADLSQRELAARAHVSPAMIGRIESGDAVPSLALFQRVLRTAGLFLTVVDEDGHVVQPMRDRDDTRDGADRRYPTHLDTILDPKSGDWWADIYGLAAPPETFNRDRRYRDARRQQTVWQVRVKQNRNAPEPPNPDTAPRYRWDPDCPRPR